MQHLPNQFASGHAAVVRRFLYGKHLFPEEQQRDLHDVRRFERQTLGSRLGVG